MKLIKVRYGQFATNIEINPCQSCGAVPTVKQAKEAVSQAWKYRERCVICGEKQELDEYYGLNHIVRCNGQTTWGLCPPRSNKNSDEKKWVSGYFESPICHGVIAHIKCLNRVAPYLETFDQAMQRLMGESLMKEFVSKTIRNQKSKNQ